MMNNACNLDGKKIIKKGWENEMTLLEIVLNRKKFNKKIPSRRHFEKARRTAGCETNALVDFDKSY